MTTLPEWLTAAGATLPAHPTRYRKDIARKTVRQLMAVISDSLLEGQTAMRAGLLQRIDPRAKVVGLLGLLVCVTLLHTLPALLAAYVVIVLLACCSRLPARRYAGVWSLAPLFSAVLMLPMTLNVFTPGDTLLPLGQWGGTMLGVTDNGLFVAARLVMRTACCIALTVLLTATTPTHRLFYGLRALGIPQLFVMLLAVMERYLHALLRTATELHLAKLSRTVIPGSVQSQQIWAAAGIAVLFRRAQRLGDGIYLAMISRGYTGATRLLDSGAWRVGDTLFLAAMALLGSILYLGERL